MATSLEISNGSATPNKTGGRESYKQQRKYQQRSVERRQYGKSNGDDGSVDGGGESDDERFFDSADTVPMSRLISRLGRQSEPLGR